MARMAETVVLATHVRRSNGTEKTVCVTACLTSLGIPVGAFRNTWNGRRNTWDGVLRRNGYAVRSRLSQLPKGCTVGKARKLIANRIAQRDPAGTRYLIAVPGHLIMLNAQGQTVVDTAPRKRDRRRVTLLVAVFPK